MKKEFREKIIANLEAHFKYRTGNSSNVGKSYARNVKINHINIPNKILDAAYNLTDKEWFYDHLNFQIEEFEHRQNNRMTIGFNGRSGGYCVLYNMSIKTLDYKTRCNRCWNNTWYEKEMKCPKCGKGTLKKLEKPMTQKQIDYTDLTDPSEMGDEDLLEIVEILLDFNQTVDAMIEETKYFASEITAGRISLETGYEPEEE